MTSRISTIIEQVAHGNLKTLRADQIELHAAYLLVDQAIFMWVSLVKIAQVTVYKAFPTKQLLISSAALTMLMGLKQPILVEPAQNLLSAGLILWIVYLFYDYLGWRDQEGLLVMPNTSSQGACVIVHENPEFIGQMLETIKQALTQPEVASYTIDCETQMIKAL